ncbi:MAG TPA: chemotaxis protein CheW [Gemmatimonadales bacterium]|nr:chemotaxis protein CheW [Gemmatimonadales bacterium]
MSEAFLLVAAAGTRVALSVAQLEAVTAAAEIVPVPVAEPAMAGVTTVRGETLPVISLARLLGRSAAREADAFVIVSAGGVRLCIAVEEAETLSRGDIMPLPPDGAMPWARAVLRDGASLVPLLDLEALAERLAATGRAS